MILISVDANYEKIDLKPALTVGVGAVAVSLPALNTAIMVRPEKIFVQARQSNTDVILVGNASVASDGSQGGFELAPGASMFLSDSNISNWKAISPSAGQKLLVTYLTRVY